jgi:DNA-binding transcriptional LysR family regulator
MFWANAKRVDSLMDAADLKVFATVARIGGMNRAANELHTVQSNVTARVRTLEEELGVQLFYRGQKGVTLTAAGERLLCCAELTSTRASVGAVLFRVLFFLR